MQEKRRWSSILLDGWWKTVEAIQSQVKIHNPESKKVGQIPHPHLYSPGRHCPNSCIAF